MKQYQKQAGFAAVEAVLVVVIVAALVGVGAWVYGQRKPKVSNSGVSPSSSSSSTAATTIDPAKTGTTDGVDQVLSAQSQAENTADNKGSAAINSSSASTKTSASNIGDSYNESTF